MKTTDRDRGWKKLITELKKANDASRAVVGIFGEDAVKDHGGVPNIDIAEKNEFGVGVPERSFIRATVDQKEKEIQGQMKASFLSVIDKKSTFKQALEQIGLYVEGQIKKRIAGGIPPPNAPSTIAKKGSSTPLIDTGQLRASVHSQARIK